MPASPASPASPCLDLVQVPEQVVTRFHFFHFFRLFSCPSFAGSICAVRVTHRYTRSTFIYSRCQSANYMFGRLTVLHSHNGPAQPEIHSFTQIHSFLRAPPTRAPPTRGPP